ncbi:hypothetical protein [Mycobacteroides abscessus]|uniref:hypothetical protein n=1 Tax=Mycobacteroides abscessus TaxID=36809 RepID=UPI0012FFF234|nr:hypothetical protein [Mycobacteroides abscessus]
MNNTQSRPCAMKLAALVIATTVGTGTVGCSAHPTPSVSSSAGETSSSAAARTMVDVEAVWQTEPLPDCPKPPIVFNGDAPQGITLPDKASVAKELAGAKSPATETWVRTKLGWVTQNLAKTRADIIEANMPSDSSMKDGFRDYVVHVRTELIAGKDIPDDLDGIFPEGCA